ncbi:MAG: hypothetical protein ACYSOV_10000, partial [Planctomycetota bacterium]
RPLDIARDRPLDIARDRPLGLARDRPLGLARDRLGLGGERAGLRLCADPGRGRLFELEDHPLWGRRIGCWKEITGLVRVSDIWGGVRTARRELKQQGPLGTDNTRLVVVVLGHIPRYLVFKVREHLCLGAHAGRKAGNGFCCRLVWLGDCGRVRKPRIRRGQQAQGQSGSREEQKHEFGFVFHFQTIVSLSRTLF